MSAADAMNVGDRALTLGAIDGAFHENIIRASIFSSEINFNGSGRVIMRVKLLGSPCIFEIMAPLVK